MTDSNVDPAVIKKTQETLGKFVKKPALTSKLLNRPPFRFLHDIIHAVIKETGFLDGLYTEAELNSENVKDRDGKINFLQKLIDVIKLTTNTKISAKPSKIVAGYEADKTNELLQLIGLAIENKLDYKSALETIKSQDPNSRSKTKEKPKGVTKKEALSNDKPAVKKDETKDKKQVKPQSIKNAGKKITPVGKNEAKAAGKAKASGGAKEAIAAQEKNITKQTKSEVKPEVASAKETKTTEKVNLEKESSKKSETVLQEAGSNIATNNAQQTNENKNSTNPERDEKVAKPNDTLAPSLPSVNTVDVVLPAETDKEEKENREVKTYEKKTTDVQPKERKKSSSKRRKSTTEEISTSEIERSNENNQKVKHEKSSGTSRKASDPLLDISQKATPSENSAQKSGEVKRQSTFIREDSQNGSTNIRPRTSLRPPSVRPASARPGAPKRRDKNVEIILQPNDQVKVAGINVKLENFESQLEDDGENLVIVESVSVLEENKRSDETHGSLDNDAQQGHLVQQILQTQKELAQADADTMNQHDVDVITFQKRQSSAHQMNSLRDVIQNLTRSINPLGKLMDFLPEDIDSMHLELNMWRDSYIQASNELKKEKGLTESAIEPMKIQFTQINANIKDCKDMIDQIRAKIVRNSDKIQKLLVEQ